MAMVGRSSLPTWVLLSYPGPGSHPHLGGPCLTLRPKLLGSLGWEGSSVSSPNSVLDTLSLLTAPIGRDPDVHQDALEGFQNAVRAGGLNTESIVIPRQSGREQAAMLSCPRPRRQPVPQDNRLPLTQLCPLGVGHMLAGGGAVVF